MCKYLKVKEIVDSVSITHDFEEDFLYAINTSDVLEGNLISPQFLSTDELKGQFKKSIKNDDILFSEIRPQNKRYALVNVDNPEKYVASTKLMVLRKINNDVNLEYFYYWLTNENFLKLLQSRAENRICSFPQITFDLLGEYNVPIPSLEVQTKIANMLKSIDIKIENNNKINTELEEMSKTIYDYWFLQFEFPNEEGNPYKSSGGKMVWNEELKREIPEGWEVEKINNILAKTESTKKYKVDEYKKSGKYPIIDQSINFICGYTNDESELIKLKDCIVFGDHTKYTKYINFDFAKGADGTQIINSKNESLPNYLLYRQILDMGLVSQGYSRYFKFLKDKDVIIPSNAISKIYIKTMKPILNKKKNIIFENQELSSLRDFLLPLLMNGQVGFKEVALDSIL